MPNVTVINECNINFVHVVGRVVSDVVLSKTKSSTTGKEIPVLNFRVLTKQFIGSKRIVNSQVHRIVCWSQLAEDTAKKIRKGMTVEVFGELVNRRYETVDRETGKPIIVVLTEVKAFKVTPFKGRIRRVRQFEEQQQDSQQDSDSEVSGSPETAEASNSEDENK